MTETGSQPEPPAGESTSSKLDVPLPALRADLEISPQVYLGEPVYVVKDPVALQYVRVRPPERFILGQLDGRTTALQIAERVASKFPNEPIEPDAVLALLNQLSAGGWLQGRSLRHGEVIRKLRTVRTRRMRRAKWLSFMFFRVSLLDPDRLLDWLYGFARPVMNPMTASAVGLFIVISTIAAVAGMGGVGELAFPVLGATNLLMLSVTFLAVKVLHEFGHGLAAKHRGLEVHEMGIFFMVFMPLFYVETSDAWMLPRRRDRLWITAGGVFIEFLFAGIAVWVWLGTEPGVVNQIAFNIMLAASVSTLLFNANPLLRYDGYYFLMDLVEIPNLRAKSSRFIGHLARRHLLLDQQSEAPVDAARRPVFMVVYAVAATIYRWFVVFGIILLIWHILDPYGLSAVGALLGTFAVCTMVIWPMAKVVRFVWQSQTRNWRRFAVTAGAAMGLGLLAAGIWMMPLEHTVERPAVILAPRSRPIFAPTNGRIEHVYVREGQYLRAGDPIYRLYDRRYQDELSRLRLEMAGAEVNRDGLWRETKPGRAAIADQEIERIAEQMQYVEERLEELTVRAPIDGQLSSEMRPQVMLGRSVERGQPLGMVLADGPRQLVIVVPEQDVASVKVEQEVRARLWADPSITLRGRVEKIGKQPIHDLPHQAVAGLYGGELDVQKRDGYNPTPSDPSVLATVRLDDPERASRLFDGMTGRGKIVLGRSRLGGQQWDRIMQAVSLDWRL